MNLRQTPALFDKRVVVVVGLLLLLAIGFWAGSRYPALNEKLMMGGQTPFLGLAFNPLLAIDAETPMTRRIVHTTINWIYGNRQGMAFGILFGAMLMTLLRLFDRRKLRGSLGNTLVGMLIGTPLGVCANCATPIGKGLHAAGGRAETMLAVILSSPTLNVVVLAMLLALFPPYVAAIKIGLTLGFVLIGVPLLARLATKPERQPAGGSTMSPLLEVETPGDSFANSSNALAADSAASWLPAARWTLWAFAVDLWFILRTTLPLMLLAGLLGSILISLVPLEFVAAGVPAAGHAATLVAMLGLALVGVVLPVPMAFDVIASAALWQAGLPVKYVLVLLFTLGIFSIYPFFIVWQSIGARVAICLLICLAGLGVAAGVVGDRYAKWDYQRQHRLFLETFSQASTKLHGPTVLRFGGETRIELADGELIASLQSSALRPVALEYSGPGDITAQRSPFQAPISHAGTTIAGATRLFGRFAGKQFGLDERYQFSVLSFEAPAVQFRGIASGDVHNDGWVDLLLTSASGLSLYANRGGRFVGQRIDIPALKQMHIVNAALVDLDNDGWLDIYVSSYRDGNYVIYNDRGGFRTEHMSRLPDPPNTVMTGAVAFGDIDKDGLLDIASGGWALPYFHGGASTPNTVILRNEKGRFRSQPLAVMGGQSLSRQTMSVLFSDIDNDGNLDLVVGNEDRGPDSYYLGRGDGSWRQVSRGERMIAHSTATTMSITSADINNDLWPEIYAGQISNAPSGSAKLRDATPALCDEMADLAERSNCREIMRIHQAMPGQTRKRDVFECTANAAPDTREDCIAFSLLLWARQTGPQAMCELFPEPWAAFRFLCRHGYGEDMVATKGAARGNQTGAPPLAGDSHSVPVVFGQNVLLMRTADGRFVDQAGAYGVQAAGFTWNAKFADLDNDEFVDLYAAQGWFPATKRESNYYFHNERGTAFTDQTEDSGMASYLSTSAYTFVDLDNDGDLDIVAVPIAGPVVVYVNNSTGNRIAFELRDQSGNRSGIGSKIIIHYGPQGLRHQMRELQAGGGFISFDAPIAHFGLGVHQRVDRVEVQWSTGGRSEIRGDFAAGSRYLIDRRAGAIVRPK